MMRNNLNRVLRMIKAAVTLLFNPRFVLCYGLAWLITNGWAYICTGIGMLADIEWLTGISAGYLTLIWIPLTPEKIITAAIAIFLLKRLFPNDQKTLAVLKRLHHTAKGKLIEHKHKENNR